MACRSATCKISAFSAALALAWTMGRSFPGTDTLDVKRTLNGRDKSLPGPKEQRWPLGIGQHGSLSACFAVKEDIEKGWTPLCYLGSL